MSDLVIDINEVEQLEDELSQFNIFEALGIRYQEVRHSDFLSWLLDPAASHRLGDLILRRVLQRAVYRAQVEVPVTPVDFDDWDLSDALIKREVFDQADRKRFDLVAISDRNRFVALLENKVWSGESPGQLLAYRDRILRQYPQYRQLLILLTPDATEPSDESYVTVSYGEIAGILEAIIQRRAASLTHDCEVGIRHYIQLLRRHFVTDSNLAELARRIYRKHRIALDYIFEQKPDVRSELRTLMEAHLKTLSHVALDEGSKSYIRFLDARWDQLSALKEGSGRWTGTCRMLLMELKNDVGKVRAILTIGPGPAATRARLRDAVRDIGKPSKKDMTDVYTRVWSETLIDSYEADEGAEAVFSKLLPKLKHVLDDILPKVTQQVEAAFADA